MYRSTLYRRTSPEYILPHAGMPDPGLEIYPGPHALLGHSWPPSPCTTMTPNVTDKNMITSWCVWCTFCYKRDLPGCCLHWQRHTMLHVRSFVMPATSMSPGCGNQQLRAEHRRRCRTSQKVRTPQPETHRALQPVRTAYGIPAKAVIHQVCIFWWEELPVLPACHIG